MVALEELINSLYETVSDAKNVPFSSDRCIIDRESVLDILDEMRGNVPTDLKMAREIVEKRAEIIKTGKNEADELRKKAEEYARKMVNESEIVVESEKRAEQIIASAEQQARQIREAALQFCAERMMMAEEGTARALEEISVSRQKFMNSIR